MMLEYILLAPNLILALSTLSMLALIFIFVRHGGNKISTKLLITLIVSAALWTSVNCIANISLNWGQEAYLWWTKLSLLGPVFMPIVLILFANAFPGDKLTMRPVYIWVLSLITSILLILIPTKYNIASVSIDDPSSLKSDIVPGPLYLTFIVYFAISVIVFILLLWNKRKVVKEKEAAQILNVLSGIILSIVTGVSLSAVLPILGVSNFISISPISVLFFIVFTGYAVLRHQLLSVKLIVAETVTYIVIFALIAEIIFSRSKTEAIIRIVLVPIISYGGFALIRSMYKEISQRESLEQLTGDLEAANVRLKQIDAMKTEFISMASHELLTPISAIEGYLSMIIDEHMVKIEDPKAKKYLTNIYLSSRRLARLVSDLLNVSRIEQGRLLMQKADADIGEVVKSTLAELKFKAEEAKITMTSNLETNELGTYIDTDKIKEVIVNLCGNSLKFTPSGGKIMVNVAIWPTDKVNEAFTHMEGHFRRDHKATSEGALQSSVNEKLKQIIGERQLVVSVTDTGMGIAKEDLGKLFQKFSRLEDVMQHSIPGTGLGLYISRALVELNHGRIWAESEGRGKGATFRFTLPMEVATPQIKEIDAQVPQAKDAKPLSRMGGEPGLNGTGDSMPMPKPRSVISEQAASNKVESTTGDTRSKTLASDKVKSEQAESAPDTLRPDKHINDATKNKDTTSSKKLEGDCEMTKTINPKQDSDGSGSAKRQMPSSMVAKIEAVKKRNAGIDLTDPANYQPHRAK